MSVERLNQVWDAVEIVFGILKGHTVRAAEAGSLRRGKVDPKDAEIVLIPKPSAWPALDAALAAGVIKKADYGGRNRWGELYRGVEANGVKVELFTAKPETWGYIYWLRTGPADANQYAVARMWKSNIRAQGGGIWYAPDWKLSERREWVSAQRQQVCVDSEADFFGLLGMGYVPPQLRRAEVYQRAMEGAGHRWGDPLALLLPSPTAVEKPAETPTQLSLF